jgi:metal-responsive CopG/Arc/MetJ family transcriptional regulator
MKLKVSISLDIETVKKIDEKMKNSFFRNRSHLIEYSINKFFKEGEEA